MVCAHNLLNTDVSILCSWQFLCICLGLCAEEIHVCGEPAAIEFIRELMYTTGEEVEVRLVVQQEERSLADVLPCSFIFVFG